MFGADYSRCLEDCAVPLRTFKQGRCRCLLFCDQAANRSATDPNRKRTGRAICHKLFVSLIMVVEAQIEDQGVGNTAELERCEKFVQRAVHSNPTVQFMVRALREAGCPVFVEQTGTPPSPGVQSLEPGAAEKLSSRICCRHCEAAVGGGFQDDGTVILCANHLQSQSMTSTTLVHELIHAYDQCRAYLDWSNCVHHACSEIRAAALSGDCDWLREVARSHFRIGGQFRRCIKRRAEMSVKMNRNCSEAEARDAVERAFEPCYRDTAPFETIP